MGARPVSRPNCSANRSGGMFCSKQGQANELQTKPPRGRVRSVIGSLVHLLATAWSGETGEQPVSSISPLGAQTRRRQLAPMRQDNFRSCARVWRSPARRMRGSVRQSASPHQPAVGKQKRRRPLSKLRAIAWCLRPSRAGSMPGGSGSSGLGGAPQVCSQKPPAWRLRLGGARRWTCRDTTSPQTALP